MEATYKKGQWKTEIIAGFNKLSEALQIDQEATAELRTFLMEKCREQYAAGNKSGIRWILKKREEEAEGPSR